MKTQTKFYFTIFLLVGTALNAQDVQLLSEEKQNLLHQQQKQYEAAHEKLRDNWIAPLNLSGSYGYDKSANDTRGDMKKISASISQDIFRSGGITYQINYADAKKRADEIGLNQQIAALNEELFTALLNYKKNGYELEQSGKRLANYDIEIFIKRHLYDAGKADITELNNALMSKSSEQKNYVSLEYAMAKARLDISKLSDIDPDSYPLYSFDLVDEREYLQNSFDLRYARAQSQTYEHLYQVTKSSYLPSIALNGSLGYQNYDSKEQLGGYNGDFYSAGISINLPLAYNASAAKEEAKAIYLKQAADTQDKERGMRASYLQSIELIKSYSRYIEITSKNLSLYDDLISVIRAGVESGYKTGYDLQTLKNSKTIDEYTIKINEINIQLELSKLHFATSANKETK
ncbi:MAG: transporter [Sulfurimonas sp. RIFCSPHIGHO2_12_FULL_36_9]|uniref:TolC family protein n=1 Tax=Sulfurimonas sp. RIFCSPLOWO2_12_36_12 TaxID=1802253 RepID=UPI0008BCD8AE|nr:TolC family protein [Sulfurimonas sp. RIFCSPLOWO2_12_36_12]OHD99686.1 MAG: transporter [Sulfurimonas sp. RIFCSPHIGHO2_12_FULL_36_9]OHE02121.1 MAG: transporter [Sulfurimonas sp. RIFCSPLOWO2_12_36_12]